MASTNTLIKNLLNVKNTVVESAKNYTDGRGVKHLRVKARPDMRNSARYLAPRVEKSRESVVRSEE